MTGTGSILAAGNTGLAVTGALISGGTLDLGNVHTNGTTNTTIDITNTGTTGPVLRGAVQNTGITSSAITLAAGNYGPLALGATTTANLSYNSATAGSLSGQSFKVVTNFDNVAPQTVNVTGAAYDLANPTISTTQPIAFGNVHVNATPSQTLSIANTTITNAAFQEGLDAAVTGTTGGVTTNGASITNLAAGAHASTAISVGIDTTTAGNKNGTATIGFTSNGSTTSHLASTPLTAQSVQITGAVYNLASSNVIAPINIVAHVGDGGGSVSQALTIENTAPTGAFSEGLDSSFGAYTPGGGDNLTRTFSGSITNLVAGSTDSTSMKATVSTATAGTFNGSTVVNQASNGATTSHLGITLLASQNVGLSGSITGGVFTFAAPTVNNTQPIDFGNVRINSSPASQSLSISNTARAASTTEALDGAVVSAPTGFNASGSFNGLAAGAPANTSIQVGMNTTAAGAQSGNVVLQFKSDGSATAGDGTVTTLTPNTSVAVTGAVFREANPTLNTPAVTLAARANTGLPTANVSVTNTSPDSFTEALKASFGTAPAGFTNTGSLGSNGLAAEGTNATGLTVGLASTATSGITTGTATVNFVSTGAGTENAADVSVGSANVSLTGKVYQTAVASITPSVSFGIVHVGDSVTPQIITVSNIASGALVDSIVGSMNVNGAPFSVSGGGTLGSGVTAGGNSGNALAVGLNTGTAGAYSGNANLTLASHDSDLADLALTTSPVTLSATVNNYAAVGLASTTKGSLTGGGSAYTLNLGTLTQGSGIVAAALAALNAALGPADALTLNSGDFTVISGGSEFGLTLNQVTDLAAGDTQDNAFDVSLDTNGTGTFEEVIQFDGFGSNDGGYDSNANVLDPTLTIEATVLPAGSGPPTGVPEPSSWLMLLSSLTGLGGIARPWRRARTGAPRSSTGALASVE